MPFVRLLTLLVTVDGYDSLSAANFWEKTVVEVSSVSPPRSRIAGILDVHIPKTGGASLVQKLWMPMVENSDELCMLKCYANYSYVKAWVKGDVCNWTAPALMTGHVSFDIVGATAILQTPKVYSLTFLRVPLTRIVSYANFNNIPLNAFVSGIWKRYATNVATMMLNGVANAEPFTPQFLLDSPVRGMCQYDPEDAIAGAQRQLVDVITVFGLTEYYVETMWLFKKTFNWSADTVQGPLLSARKSFCSQNRDPEACGKNRFSLEDLDPNTRHHIFRAEVCDNAVYEVALEVFKARIEAGDQEDLAAFRSAIMMS